MLYLTIELDRKEYLMLNFNLNVHPKTARRLKKVLEYSRDEEAFAQSFIAYQIAELRRAILNLRLELNTLEEKYKMPSTIFHKKFNQGQMDDSEDFILWAGAYEMLEKNETRLQGLEG
jgi:hypothetical protein